MQDFASENLNLTENASELRARSVWLITKVSLCTWLFFFGVLQLFGFEHGAVVCGAEILIALSIFLLFRKSTNYLLIMNLNLLCCASGMWFISYSDPLLARTIYFVPVSILLASQLFGNKQALVWWAVSVALMSTFYVATHGWGISGSQFVELSLLLGVPGCIMFCCYQAEIYYRQKTSGLVEFSKSLQEKSDELEVLATTDSLTKLTNRYQFQNKLDQQVQLAWEGHPFALFLIDMDGFKDINDTMGHAVGDEVLVEIGKRLEQNFGNAAGLARLGGDEFCVLVDGISTDQAARSLGQQLHETLTRRYHLNESEFSLGTSIGYALCPKHAESAKHLLAFADTAMYHAKHNQLAVARYSNEMTLRLVENRSINEKLATAIEQDEFFLVYQPQFDLATGAMSGVEALLRWRSNGEVVMPYRFIHLLEQSGRIVEVSNWVIQEACRQQVTWKNAGLDTRIAVNISAVHFEHAGFIKSVIEPIRTSKIEPSKIELEITEGLLINNVEKVVAKLDRIKKFGIPISIDDFGTGYSSLAYLRQFPIDTLKIDRAFVKDIPDQDDGVIASSIILLGHVLGMKVLAEGVETQQQLEHLKKHGCDEIQGYLFSRPIAPEEVLEKYADIQKVLV